MSLARVLVPNTDFDVIHSHLTSHMPKYRNMHLREARQRNKKRVLRYLHAMHAPKGLVSVEGMISGPGVFWHYELIRYKSRTQLNVFDEEATSKDLDRIEKYFLPEILDRIDLEKGGVKYAPTRLSGQYYLIRSWPGTAASHPTCARAVAEGMLDERFVERLYDWGFRLFLQP